MTSLILDKEQVKQVDLKNRLNRLILTRSYEKKNYDYVTNPQGFRQF